MSYEETVTVTPAASSKSSEPELEIDMLEVGEAKGKEGLEKLDELVITDTSKPSCEDVPVNLPHVEEAICLIDSTVLPVSAEFEYLMSCSLPYHIADERAKLKGVPNPKIFPFSKDRLREKIHRKGKQRRLHKFETQPEVIVDIAGNYEELLHKQCGPSPFPKSPKTFWERFSGKVFREPESGTFIVNKKSTNEFSIKIPRVDVYVEYREDETIKKVIAPLVGCPKVPDILDSSNSQDSSSVSVSPYSVNLPALTTFTQESTIERALRLARERYSKKGENHQTSKHRKSVLPNESDKASIRTSNKKVKNETIIKLRPKLPKKKTPDKVSSTAKSASKLLTTKSARSPSPDLVKLTRDLLKKTSERNTIKNLTNNMTKPVQFPIRKQRETGFNTDTFPRKEAELENILSMPGIFDQTPLNTEHSSTYTKCRTGDITPEEKEASPAPSSSTFRFRSNTSIPTASMTPKIQNSKLNPNLLENKLQINGITKGISTGVSQYPKITPRVQTIRKRRENTVATDVMNLDNLLEDELWRLLEDTPLLPPLDTNDKDPVSRVIQQTPETCPSESDKLNFGNETSSSVPNSCSVPKTTSVTSQAPSDVNSTPQIRKSLVPNGITKLISPRALYPTLKGFRIPIPKRRRDPPATIVVPTTTTQTEEIPIEEVNKLLLSCGIMNENPLERGIRLADNKYRRDGSDFVDEVEDNESDKIAEDLPVPKKIRLSSISLSVENKPGIRNPEGNAGTSLQSLDDDDQDILSIFADDDVDFLL